MANLDSGGTAATFSLTHVEYPEGDKVNSGTHERGRRPLCLFDFVIKQIVLTVEHQRFKHELCESCLLEK